MRHGNIFWRSDVDKCPSGPRGAPQNSKKIPHGGLRHIGKFFKIRFLKYPWGLGGYEKYPWGPRGYEKFPPGPQGLFKRTQGKVLRPCATLWQPCVEVNNLCQPFGNLLASLGPPHVGPVSRVFSIHAPWAPGKNYTGNHRRPWGPAAHRGDFTSSARRANTFPGKYAPKAICCFLHAFLPTKGFSDM